MVFAACLNIGSNSDFTCVASLLSTLRKRQLYRLSNRFSVISFRALREGLLHLFFPAGQVQVLPEPVNHSSCISASTAEMSRSADASWGKIPTTRVRLRISRCSLSSPLIGSDPSPPAPRKIKHCQPFIHVVFQPAHELERWTTLLCTDYPWYVLCNLRLQQKCLRLTILLGPM